ncbi:MAG TPA: bis(5'-nucleosyl)-tetraphosphatase PrpE [Bacillota bacterium]
MKIDVIGDIHGCYDELCELFLKLGYTYKEHMYIHPDQRIPVFIGDITDRGPNSISVIQLVYRMVVQQKLAKYVPGNHCNKLYRYFLGNNVKLQHGIETTVHEYVNLQKTERRKVKDQFIELYETAPLYLQIPEVGAIIAHAGIKQSYIGKMNKQVKTFVLYGDITGEVHKDGRPVRKDWAQHYYGDDWIVYGHTPVKKPRIVHKTINIDTGCVFGNTLTAFRLPEEIIISVPSKQSFVANRFRSFETD